METDTSRSSYREGQSWGEWCFFTQNRQLQLLQILWWIWFLVIAGIFVAPDPGVSTISPFLTGMVWWLVVAFRRPLREAVRKIPGPVWVRFFIIGIVMWDVVMESLAVSFQGDLHPNLFISNFLWLGACLGTVGSWWVLAHVFRYSAIQVLFIYALKGVLIEQFFLIPMSIIRGEIGTALILIPFVGVVYSVAIAPVFLLIEDEMPKAVRSPGVSGVLLGILFPTAMFFAGHSIWYKLLELAGFGGLLSGG